MHVKRQLAIAGVAATLVMVVTIALASANRLSLSNRNFRVTWTGLRFLTENGTSVVTCPVTLEGSFHSQTISKIEKALIGHVSRAVVSSSSCRGGHWTMLQESLPWHVTYNGFSGNLPRITSSRLLIKGVAFLLEVPLFAPTCLYKEAVEGQEEFKGEALVAAGGAITGLEADRTIRIAKFSGSGLCPSAIGFEGNGTFTLLGNTTSITIRLI